MMMKKQYLLVLIAIFMMFAVAIITLVITTSDSEDEAKVQVLVSIQPQKQFVKEVGGAHVEVKALLEPGESPATSSLTSSDIQQIEQSDVYFRIGYIPFEKSNIEKIKSLNPDMQVVQITDEVELRYFGEQQAKDSDKRKLDPHLWLSIQNMQKHVQDIADNLSDIDADNTTTYQENALAYQSRLTDLDQNVSQQLNQVRGQHLLVFHPAWGYFADEYGLEQIAIEKDGNDPTSQQLQDIIETAAEEDINVVFVQKQFSTAAAESIAEELNVPVVQIDPLAENYLENMRDIAKQLQNYLQS